MNDGEWAQREVERLEARIQELEAALRRIEALDGTWSSPHPSINIARQALQRHIVTRSSAVTEVASEDEAVSGRAPASLSGFLGAPEPLEAPIDFTLAVPRPRMSEPNRYFSKDYVLSLEDENIRVNAELARLREKVETMAADALGNEGQLQDEVARLREALKDIERRHPHCGGECNDDILRIVRNALKETEK